MSEAVFRAAARREITAEEGALLLEEERNRERAWLTAAAPLWLPAAFRDFLMPLIFFVDPRQD